ncbi:MAG: response regulator [Flaviaesturariibacter sp.]|nr:response regulator [Flaviaesturariibacter sp.]
MQPQKYIIYVDDDFDDKELLQEAFQEIPDYELVTLDDGLELIQYLEKATSLPNLIILDINMPALNGRDTMRILRAEDQFRDIPLVMFSTTSNPIEIARFRASKIDLINKPVNYSSVKGIVQQLISHAR